MSASTHMPPTGTHWPRSTRSEIFANSSGMPLLDPGVVLRRRRGEHVLGVVVHQRDGGGERADALALGLADRPQPGGVDVRVADGDGTVTCRRSPKSSASAGAIRRRAAATSGIRSSVSASSAQQARTSRIVEWRGCASRRRALRCRRRAPRRRDRRRPATPVGIGRAARSPAVSSEPSGDGGTGERSGSTPPRRASTTGPGRAVERRSWCAVGGCPAAA